MQYAEVAPRGKGGVADVFDDIRGVDAAVREGIIRRHLRVEGDARAEGQIRAAVGVDADAGGRGDRLPFRRVKEQVAEGEGGRLFGAADLLEGADDGQLPLRRGVRLEAGEAHAAGERARRAGDAEHEGEQQHARRLFAPGREAEGEQRRGRREGEGEPETVHAEGARRRDAQPEGARQKQERAKVEGALAAV